MYVAFVGFTKAVDYLVWDGIWYELITFGISGKLLDYKLYRFLTVYMGSYTRRVLIRPEALAFIILQDVFRTWKVVCVCYMLCRIGYYFQVTIIGLSSPLVASLYNIGTRLCSQRTTSSSSKCREKMK